MYDDEQDSQSRLALIVNAEHRLYFVNFVYDAEKVGTEVTGKLKVLPIVTQSQSQTLRNLVKVDGKNYIFDYKGGAQVFHLVITDTKDLCLAKPIYEESNYEMIAMQADQKRIYVMVKDRF